MSKAVRFLDPRTGDGMYHFDDSAPRPNIVFISVDMIPEDVYRPEHRLRRFVHTPNLDSLAVDGTRFTNAFSVSALCGPSRAGYLTGRYPYITAAGRPHMSGIPAVERIRDEACGQKPRGDGSVSARVRGK